MYEILLVNLLLATKWFLHSYVLYMHMECKTERENMLYETHAALSQFGYYGRQYGFWSVESQNGCETGYIAHYQHHHIISCTHTHTSFTKLSMRHAMSMRQIWFHTENGNTQLNSVSISIYIWVHWMHWYASTIPITFISYFLVSLCANIHSNLTNINCYHTQLIHWSNGNE